MKESPIFPTKVTMRFDVEPGESAPINVTEWMGLTKREYFAGQIMAALASDWRHYFLKGSQSNVSDLVAKRSIMLADALLKELEGE